MAGISPQRLAHLPFLTAHDIDLACLQLREAYDACPTVHHGGGSCTPLQIEVLRDQDAGRFLRLKRPVQDPAWASQRRPHSAPAEEDDLYDTDVEIDEVDEQVVRPDNVPDPDCIATVEFDVLLSPTYQVPVLYFRLLNVLSGYPDGVDFVYQYLVPKNSLSQLQQTSVMGGISIQNHPVTDLPCFFVHPCNTPDAMRELLGRETVTELQYMQIWFGLIGASVGLHLPKELAVAK